MSLAFLIANLKWIVLGILGLLAAKEIKESGRKGEKLKHLESKNKTLVHQQQFVVSEAKRSEERAKAAQDFSVALERKLMEVDPASLDAVKLDLLSSQPLSFTDIHTSPEQHQIPSKKEDEK